MQKVLILALAMLCSCSLKRAALVQFERQMLWQLDNALYIRNPVTGLCYMATDAYHSVNLECVPCDSLKKVRILTIKPRP